MLEYQDFDLFRWLNEFHSWRGKYVRLWFRLRLINSDRVGIAGLRYRPDIHALLFDEFVVDQEGKPLIDPVTEEPSTVKRSELMFSRVFRRYFR